MHNMAQHESSLAQCFDCLPSRTKSKRSNARLYMTPSTHHKKAHKLLLLHIHMVASNSLPLGFVESQLHFTYKPAS